MGTSKNRNDGRWEGWKIGKTSILPTFHPSCPDERGVIRDALISYPLLTVASEAMPILANHVYVIPSDSDLTMENYSFKVISPRSVGHKQIDLFFISLAEAMGARAVGIVLSGYDGDGTEGCKHIKAKGGKMFAQDMSAEVDSMPLSARAALCIDFVLPLNKIPAKLKSLAVALKA